jgi:predicted lipid-binding transport protein (Tim44 family)
MLGVQHPPSALQSQAGPAAAPGAYWCMSRMIWTILGAILAVWLAFTAIGWIFAMLKTFLVFGLIAVVVVIIVWLLAGRARRDNAAQ